MTESTKNRRNRSRFIAAATLAIGTAVGSVQAATVTWSNATPPGVWSNAANWTGGTGVPTSADDVVFGPTGASATQGTLTNEVDTDFSLNSLVYAQRSDLGFFHTTQIDSGVTLSVIGTGDTAFYVGDANEALTDTSATVVTTITGAGTLDVDNTGATFAVRQGKNSGTAGSPSATLDMSTLANFNANVENFLIGVGAGSSTQFNRASGIVLMSPNSTVTAGTVTVGFVSASGGPQSQLLLGANNTFNVGTFQMGTRKGNGLAAFQSTVTNGVFKLRGVDGIGRANLNLGLGQVGDGTGSSAHGTLDLTSTSGGSGSIDALVDTLALGRGSGGTAHGTGQLTYDQGIVDANTAVLGDTGGGTGNGSGTLQVLGTGQLVVHGNMTLGFSALDNGTLTVSGTGTGASASIAGNITTGGDGINGLSAITVATGSLSAAHIGSSANPISSLTLNTGSLSLLLDPASPARVAAFSADGTNVLLPKVSGGVAPGTYTLIDYNTIAGAGFSTLSLGKLPARMVASLVDNAGNTSVDLNVTSFDSPLWTAGVNNVWDINSTSNWKLINAGTATTYQEDLVTYATADNVTFDNTAANGNVNVSTNVTPGSVTINDSALNYSFTGTGGILGGNSLTKSGGGTVTFANTGGSVFGAVTVDGGTLQIGDGATAGVGFSAGAIANSGTLVLDRPDANTLAASISGVGDVNKISAGATTLSGSSSYTGTTNINAGSIIVTNSASLGDTTGGTVNIAAGAQLDLTGVTSANALDFGAKQFNIAGTGPDAAGAIVYNGGAIDQTQAFNTVALTADATVGGTGRFDIRGSGTSQDSLNLNGHTLTIAGTGPDSQLSLVYTDVSDGNIVINGGTLSIETTSNVPAGAGSITYNAGTTGQFFRPTGDISRTLNVNGATLTDASQTNAVTIASPLVFGGNNTIQISSSTGFTFSGGITETTPSSLTKTGAGTLILSGASNTFTGGLNVNEGTMQLASSGSVNVIKTGAVSVTTKLDLTDGKLISTAPGAAGTWDTTNLVYTGLTGLVASGRNLGAWDGVGITTSSATPGNNLTTLAVAKVGDFKGIADGATTTFGGQTVQGSDSVVMYTYGGDANLDGKINIDDYGRIDGNVGLSGTVFGWYNGDFNYDGKINIDDYGIIDGNIGIQGAPFPTVAQSLAGFADAGVSAVPEPATMSIMGILGAGLLRRRRRR